MEKSLKISAQPKKSVANAISTCWRDIDEEWNEKTYADLYSNVTNSDLATIFSVLHYGIVECLESVNRLLPISQNANQLLPGRTSCELLGLIKTINALKQNLEGTSNPIRLDPYYEELFSMLETFLQYDDSVIPGGTDSIDIYYRIPIFSMADSLEMPADQNGRLVSLKAVGSGAYAEVFKFHDPFLDETFCLKRAKKDLAPKELERFKQEFEEMSRMSSPYILKVYKYNEGTPSYIMECMDTTLNDYINKNNGSLSVHDRKKILTQVFCALEYLHKNNIYHRDISPNNVLLKKYGDGTVIAKLSDFGLVKLPDSTLTTSFSEVRGSFNDPGLAADGFENYGILHETYAATRLAYFVLTGKRVIESPKAPYKELIETGLNPDKSKRFQSIKDLEEWIRGKIK